VSLVDAKTPSTSATIDDHVTSVSVSSAVCCAASLFRTIASWLSASTSSAVDFTARKRGSSSEK
jgi:hypothetical protein